MMFVQDVGLEGTFPPFSAGSSQLIRRHLEDLQPCLNVKLTKALGVDLTILNVIRPLADLILPDLLPKNMSENLPSQCQPPTPGMTDYNLKDFH
jgi:hypothetical protein